jgi:hypothetical protein
MDAAVVAVLLLAVMVDMVMVVMDLMVGVLRLVLHLNLV